MTDERENQNPQDQNEPPVPVDPALAPAPDIQTPVNNPTGDPFPQPQPENA